MRHKHADLICAWANGAQIQFLNKDNRWNNTIQPSWYECSEYRVKPEPKSDVALCYGAHLLGISIHAWPQEKSNLKLTFDGETGELKAAEVLR